MRNAARKHAGRVFAAGTLLFMMLFLAGVPWRPFDYAFTVVFHAYLMSIPVFVFAGVIYMLLGVAGSVAGAVAEREDGVGGRISRMKESTGAALSFLLTIYCLSVFAAGAALDLRFAAAMLFSVAAAAFVTSMLNVRRGGDSVWNAAAAAVVSVAAAAAGLAAAGGAVTAAASPVVLLPAVLIPAGFVFPALKLKLMRGTLWSNIRRNRWAAAGIGLLIGVSYFVWTPCLARRAGQPVTIENRFPGAGNAMIFAPDGESLVYLDKIARSARLFERKNLAEKAAVGFKGTPRDIVYDREDDLFYVVLYGVRREQLVLVSPEPFHLTGSVTVPPDNCTLINAVGIDYRHGRILVGCDSSGNLYYIRRGTLEAPEDPVAQPKPAGKGIVRLLVDEERDRVLTVGCLLGPYLNEIDLGSWRLARKKFTGRLNWEAARDRRTGRLFTSVPFRSMVAVVDEKTLETERLLKTGFGARALTVDVEGRRLFVGAQLAGTVDVFDLDTFRLLRRFYLPAPRFFLYSREEAALYAATSRGLFKIFL